MIPEPLGVTKTLNVHAVWTEVLPALGIPVTSHALPATVRCPLCSGVLGIYEDTISGGEWHYCFTCGSHGDMIELAAGYWRLTIKATVRKLARKVCLIPEARLTLGMLNSYHKYHVERRERINLMYRSARKYLTTRQSDTLRVLKNKFRLSHTLPNDRWKNGPGQMVGAYTKLGIELAICSNADENVTRKNHSYIFKGRGWNDILVVPHYSLPGRICGFVFAGRNGEKDDILYHRITTGRKVSLDKQKPYEAGLGGLWAVYNAQTVFDNHVVAVADTFLALRLQTRNAATSTSPLPLVSYYDSPTIRTRSAWVSLSPKKVTIWGWRLTAGLLCQAIAADADIRITTLDNLSQFSIDHYIRDHEPREIIRSVVKNGKPWRQFLVEWADNVSDADLADLMIELEAYQLDIEQVANLSSRIRKFCSGISKMKAVRLATGVEVFEYKGKWWTNNNGLSKKAVVEYTKGTNSRLIMNATLRINATKIKVRDGKQTAFYEGVLKYDGEEIHFCLPTKKMLAATAAELTMLIAKKRPGAVLFIATQWNRQLLEAGMLFSQHC